MSFSTIKSILAAIICSVAVFSTHAIAQDNTETASAVERARTLTDEAKLLFAKAEYNAAKQKLDEVVQLVPQSANAYQFRSLASFAARDYEAAAADAYDAMSLGSSWTTPVIKSLYGGQLLPYQKQFAQLKRVVRTDSAMPSHFLLAYHHVVNKQWQHAKNQLEMVLELQPDEPLANGLLKAVNGKLAEKQNGRVAARR